MYVYFRNKTRKYDNHTNLSMEKWYLWIIQVVSAP